MMLSFISRLNIGVVSHKFYQQLAFTKPVNTVEQITCLLEIKNLFIINLCCKKKICGLI